MKKLFSSKFLKITCLVLFVSIISITVYSSMNTVTANDTVGMKQFNKTVTELKTSIEELNNKIVKLETENVELNADLETAKKKVTDLEKNNNDNKTTFTSVTNRLTKIETRENYLYSQMKDFKGDGILLSVTAQHIIDNLK